MNRGDLVGYATHRALTAGSEKGSEIHLMKRTDAACLTQAVFANDCGFGGEKKSNPVVKTDAVEMCDKNQVRRTRFTDTVDVTNVRRSYVAFKCNLTLT